MSGILFKVQYGHIAPENLKKHKMPIYFQQKYAKGKQVYVSNSGYEP